ncbi:hypothetical protein QQ045_032474 [Rhodiola kirilowii]
MKEHMEVEGSEPRNIETPAVAANGGAVLPLVGPNESGIGYPYAPENWPKPGDNWRWKVGSRITKRDHHVDRYLYAPKRLPQPRLFASKTSLERYIRKEFSNTDVDTFFSMFTWNIPARKPICSDTDYPLDSSSSESSSDMEDGSGSESQLTKCPAGKIFCKGLLLEAQSPTMPCDICCTASNFCRHCSCILCKRNVRSALGGYSYFRCEAVVNETYTCGHVAHLDCALRCYMAGTVGGVFDLDAAYYCRLCDARSDLVPHARKLVEICKSIDSGSDMENILKLGICILRGSEREAAQEILHLIEKAFYKLKTGSSVEGIWESDDKLSAMPLNELRNEIPTTNMDGSFVEAASRNSAVANPSDEQEINPLKLEDEIYKTLQSLKKSQEAEYQLAQEKLYAQKAYLINLQEQLEHEKIILADRAPSDPGVKQRTEQIKRELKKLSDMKEVSKGFLKAPQYVVEEHFGRHNND